MNLSCKDGKIIVSIGEEKLTVTQAMMQYPKVAKQIVTYAKRAKALSKAKVVVARKEISESYNKRDFDDSANFYIGNDLIASIEHGDRGASIYDITEPNQDYMPYYQVQKIRDFKRIYGVKEIDWVNGTYIVNGKPMTLENYKFMQSYLNGVDLDITTGKFLSMIDPSFELNNLERLNENRTNAIFSLGKGKQIRIETNNLSKQDGLVDWRSQIYLKEGKTHKEICLDRVERSDIPGLNFTNICDEKKGYLADILQNKGVDLINAKSDALVEDYVNNAKLKEKSNHEL